MAEPRDQPPTPGSYPPVVASARLSPLQEAWSRYVTHTTTCGHCRDIDRGRCERSETLWRAYQAHDEQAYRGITGGT